MNPDEKCAIISCLKNCQVGDVITFDGYDYRVLGPHSIETNTLPVASVMFGHWDEDRTRFFTSAGYVFNRFTMIQKAPR